MDCRELEERLERFLDGELPAATRALCERHLRRCRRCRELLAPLAAATDAPEELLGAVLARTSGPACGRAHELLCGWVDGTLPASEEQLAGEHLAGCPDCAALASVLEQLGRDLPRLAELRPDEGFVEAVLAATLPASVRLRRWWTRSWPRWVWRPRFASEAAFVATLVLVLVVAVPGSPLAAVPGRALALARTDPMATLEPPVASLEKRVSGRLEHLRREAGGRLEEVRRQAATRAGGALAAVRGWLSEEIGTLRGRAASLLERADREPADEAPATEAENKIKETP